MQAWVLGTSLFALNAPLVQIFRPIIIGPAVLLLLVAGVMAWLMHQKRAKEIKIEQAWSPLLEGLGVQFKIRSNSITAYGDLFGQPIRISGGWLPKEGDVTLSANVLCQLPRDYDLQSDPTSGLLEAQQALNALGFEVNCNGPSLSIIIPRGHTEHPSFELLFTHLCAMTRILSEAHRDTYQREPASRAEKIPLHLFIDRNLAALQTGTPKGWELATLNMHTGHRVSFQVEVTSWTTPGEVMGGQRLSIYTAHIVDIPMEVWEHHQGQPQFEGFGRIHHLDIVGRQIHLAWLPKE